MDHRVILVLLERQVHLVLTENRGRPVLMGSLRLWCLSISVSLWIGTS